MPRSHRLLTVLLAAGAATTVGVAGWAVGGSGTVQAPPRIAFVANGVVPADALAAGGIAGQLGAPVFTTPKESLATAAASALSGYAPELVIVLGGPGAISDQVLAEVSAATGLAVSTDDAPEVGIVRAAGANRYETAAAVAGLLASYAPAYLPVDATALGAVDSDTLDGLDATDFARSDQACSPGDVVVGIGTDGTPTCTTLADEVDGGDAATLDGLDSSDLVARRSPTTLYFATDNLVDLDSTTDRTLADVSFSLPDECGDGSTQHRLLVEGDGFFDIGAEDAAGAEYDMRAWLGIDDFAIGSALDVTIESGTAQSNHGVANLTYGDFSLRHVALMGPGLHEARMVGDLFYNGDPEVSTYSTSISVELLGWTCA